MMNVVLCENLCKPNMMRCWKTISNKLYSTHLLHIYTLHIIQYMSLAKLGKLCDGIKYVYSS